MGILEHGLEQPPLPNIRHLIMEHSMVAGLFFIERDNRNNTFGGARRTKALCGTCISHLPRSVPCRSAEQLKKLPCVGANKVMGMVRGTWRDAPPQGHSVWVCRVSRRAPATFKRNYRRCVGLRRRALCDGQPGAFVRVETERLRRNEQALERGTLALP